MLYSAQCLVQLLAVTLRVYFTPVTVVALVLRGPVLPRRGICVCRGGYDGQANQEFVLRYQRGGQGGGCSSKTGADRQKGGRSAVRRTPRAHRAAHAERRSPAEFGRQMSLSAGGGVDFLPQLQRAAGK